MALPWYILPAYFFRRWFFACISLLLLVNEGVHAPAARAADGVSTLEELDVFLTSQLVPNAVVPTPTKGRAGLILSYKMAPEAEGYRFTYSRSHLYDNGLAAIAFVLLNKPAESERILDAIVGGAFGRRDLWFSVNTHNEWPTAQDSDWATTRAGATAWAGYALVFYIADKEIASPGVLGRDLRLRRYLDFAEELGDSLLSRQVRTSTDPRHGLITGGSGVISLVVRGSDVEERFERREVDWISYENNIDAYFFLRDLAALSPGFRMKHGAFVTLLGQSIPASVRSDAVPGPWDRIRWKPWTVLRGDRWHSVRWVRKRRLTSR